MGALTQITAVLTIYKTEWPTAYFGVNMWACDEADTDVSAEEEAEQTDLRFFKTSLTYSLFDPGEKERFHFFSLDRGPSTCCE